MKANVIDFPLNMYQKFVLNFNPEMGRLRFIDLMECVALLKDPSAERKAKESEPQRIMLIANHKIDLFTKFIGLDKT